MTIRANKTAGTEAVPGSASASFAGVESSAGAELLSPGTRVGSGGLDCGRGRVRSVPLGLDASAATVGFETSSWWRQLPAWSVRCKTDVLSHRIVTLSRRRIVAAVAIRVRSWTVDRKERLVGRIDQYPP